MPYKFDFDDGDVVAWEPAAAGGGATRVTDYTPTVYVGARAGHEPALAPLADDLAADPRTVRVREERWYTRLDAAERRPVLRVDLERVDEVRAFAWGLRRHHEFDRHAPGTFRCYNVDLTPGFRYCLETGTDPTPADPPSTLALAADERALARGDVTAVRVDGEPVADRVPAVLRGVAAALEHRDPDVLVCSSAELVPRLHGAAEGLGADWFGLGRRPGHRQLAGASVFERRGVVGHSPARYTVPGRAIVDASAGFLWGKAGLEGLLELTERAWKPIAEAGWASIGNLLTAVQVREALRARDVLVPWNKTEPEAYKALPQLHAADRGGHIVDPRVGLVEAVHELDFASLYPSLMVAHNLSPETVRCPRHPEASTVPELGYRVCAEPGLVPAVLEPIIADRQAIKRAIAGTDDPEERATLERRSTALKWLLVTCFGYQGYHRSKFGRIEVHEAITAHARDALLTAKATLEAGGWSLVHGIVDGLFVTPADGQAQTPLAELAAEITDAVGVPLEYERAYDWFCVVPRRDRAGGALTRYFGKPRDAEGYRVRGIECRQRSTPPFVAAVQRELLDVLDAHRAPEPVADRLAVHLARLRAGDVAPDELLIRERVSKRHGEYDRATPAAAALARYDAHDLARAPGQAVRYVVVDDGARRPADRVRLGFEDPAGYDVDVYERALRRAGESLLAPLGWDGDALRAHLAAHADAALSAFG